MNISLPENSPNRGVVREIDMAVLPNVGSKTCLVLVVLALIVNIFFAAKRTQCFSLYSFQSGNNLKERSLLNIV